MGGGTSTSKDNKEDISEQPPEEDGEPKAGETDAGLHKLPLQLKRLPRARLQAVSEALAVLKENGLTEQVNVDELFGVVKASLPKVMLTEYREMCDWARTPNTWARGAGPVDPSKGCSFADVPPEEWVKAAEELAAEQAAAAEAATPAEWPRPEGEGEQAAEPQPVESLKARLPYRRSLRARQERGDMKDYELKWEACFETFCAAQLTADLELRRLADPGFAPKSLGSGPSVLFQKAPPGMKLPTHKAKRRLASAQGLEAPKTVLSSGGALCVATVHIGAAGCGMGAALWRRLLREHKVGADGQPAPDAFGLSRPHFNEATSGRLVPRALFVADSEADLEPARQLGAVAPDDLVGGEGYAAANFYDYAIASEETARLLYDAAVEGVRRQAERMDRTGSIVLTHSLLEPCGAGLVHRLLEHLSSEYAKATRQAVSIGLPSQFEVTDVMHLVSSCRTIVMLKEHMDMNVLVDEDAMHGLCTGKRFGLGIASPGRTDYYSLVGGVLAAWTSPFRMGPCINAGQGTLRTDLRKVVSNLVPYPRINTVLASLAPLRPADSADFKVDGTSALVVEGLRKGCLSSVNMQESKNISIGLCCRGLPHYAVVEAIARFKTLRDCQFVDWSPTGFLAGCHDDPTAAKDGECSCLFNNSAIGGLLGKWRAALEERMEDCKAAVESSSGAGDLEEALNDLAAYEKDYEEVATETAQGEEEE